HALAGDLRELVCPRLPASFLLGCTDFINLYGPTTIYMTTQQVTSEQLCTGLHMCSTEAFMATRQVPYAELDSFKCDSCKEISEYLQRDLSRREFREDVIEEIRQYVCQAVPDSLYYICDNLAKSYVPLAITKVLQSLQDGHLCH
ncbi:proactivator polypeptide, partial [Aphelenchoides avenae]